MTSKSRSSSFQGRGPIQVSECDLLILWLTKVLQRFRIMSGFFLLCYDNLTLHRNIGGLEIKESGEVNHCMQFMILRLSRSHLGIRQQNHFKRLTTAMPEKKIKNKRVWYCCCLRKWVWVTIALCLTSATLSYESRG